MIIEILRSCRRLQVYKIKSLQLYIQRAHVATVIPYRFVSIQIQIIKLNERKIKNNLKYSIQHTSPYVSQLRCREKERGKIK